MLHCQAGPKMLSFYADSPSDALCPRIHHFSRIHGFVLTVTVQTY